MPQDCYPYKWEERNPRCKIASDNSTGKQTTRCGLPCLVPSILRISSADSAIFRLSIGTWFIMRMPLRIAANSNIRICDESWLLSMSIRRAE